jgi:hypothetical protein
MSYRRLGVGCAILAIAIIGGFWMIARAVPPDAAPAAQMRAEGIAKQRFDTAQEGYRIAAKIFRTGSGSAEDVSQWLRRRMQARLDLAKSPADRIKALEQNIEEFRAEEKEVEGMHRAGVATSNAIYLARYNVLDAELMLARERESGAAK